MRYLYCCLLLFGGTIYAADVVVESVSPVIAVIKQDYSRPKAPMLTGLSYLKRTVVVANRETFFGKLARLNPFYKPKKVPVIKYLPTSTTLMIYNPETQKAVPKTYCGNID